VPSPGAPPPEPLGRWYRSPRGGRRERRPTVELCPCQSEGSPTGAHREALERRSQRGARETFTERRSRDVGTRGRAPPPAAGARGSRFDRMHPLDRIHPLSPERPTARTFLGARVEWHAGGGRGGADGTGLSAASRGERVPPMRALWWLLRFGRRRRLHRGVRATHPVQGEAS